MSQQSRPPHVLERLRVLRELQRLMGHVKLSALSLRHMYRYRWAGAPLNNAARMSLRDLLGSAAAVERVERARGFYMAFDPNLAERAPRRRAARQLGHMAELAGEAVTVLEAFSLQAQWAFIRAGGDHDMALSTLTLLHNTASRAAAEEWRHARPPRGRGTDAGRDIFLARLGEIWKDKDATERPLSIATDSEGPYGPGLEFLNCACSGLPGLANLGPEALKKAWYSARSNTTPPAA